MENKHVENLVMEPDWDLHAVVKGFTDINKRETLKTTSASAFTVNVNHIRSSCTDQGNKRHGFCSTDLDVVEELEELSTTSTYLLDYSRRITQSVQPTVSSYLAALQAYKKRMQPQHKERHLYETISASSAAVTTQITPKPKRWKSHRKRICHVRAAETLSSDAWSWRKYGQKPIKGSPYPRSYYKCSSSKTCLARKQVERNRSDKNMFIVTYKEEHNHRAPTYKNALAGTTRNPNTLTKTSKLSSTNNSTSTMSTSGSLDDDVLQQIKEMKCMDDDDVMKFYDMDDDVSCRTMDDCFFEDGFLPRV